MCWKGKNNELVSRNENKNPMKRSKNTGNSLAELARVRNMATTYITIISSFCKNKGRV